MLGFSPLAASALADDGERGFVAFDIVAGSVVVPSITMFEEESFAIADFTLTPVVDDITVGTEYGFVLNDLVSTPTVESINALFQQLLTPDEITSSAPVVDAGDLTFFHDFAAAEIALGAPSVDSIDPQLFHNFNANSVSASPVVDGLPFAQKHILAGDDVTAGVPTIPVRFLWDFQEPVVKTWTEVSDINDTWTVLQSAA